MFTLETKNRASMNRIKFTVVIVASLFVGIGVFYACKKESKVRLKEDMTCSLKPSVDISKPLKSYTANDREDEFYFDASYENPYNHIGLKHNLLVNELFQKWDFFIKDGEDKLIVNLFAYAVPRSQDLCNIRLDEYGITETEFTATIMKAVQPYAKLNYMEMLKRIFKEKHPDNYLGNFFEEFSTRFNSNADLTYLNPIEIKIIEQRIVHSNIGDDAKNDYLLFCAVYRHSLENLQEWFNNEDKPPILYAKEKKVTGDMVIADGVAAVKGLIAGAEAGVAGGVWGSVILGTVGAVCYGALGTAVEVGVKKQGAALIDKILGN